MVSFVSNQVTAEDGKRNLLGQAWHTDHSFQPEPPKATMLYAVELPEQGGDTCFANMRAAYASLPQAMKQRVAKLKAVHAYRESREPPSLEERRHEEETDCESVTDGVVHPLVRTHPGSGKPAIYINPLRVKRFLGMTAEQSASLIDALSDFITQSRFVYRHHWRQGDLVIWDNRQAMHRVEHNYDLGQKRLMHRIILQGDRPR